MDAACSADGRITQRKDWVSGEEITYAVPQSWNRYAYVNVVTARGELIGTEEGLCLRGEKCPKPLATAGHEWQTRSASG